MKRKVGGKTRREEKDGENNAERTKVVTTISNHGWNVTHITYCDYPCFPLTTITHYHHHYVQSLPLLLSTPVTAHIWAKLRVSSLTPLSPNNAPNNTMSPALKTPIKLSNNALSLPLMTLTKPPNPAMSPPPTMATNPPHHHPSVMLTKPPYHH